MASIVGLTNYMERQMLRQLFTNVAIDKIPVFWIGLSSTTPNEEAADYNFTEPGDTYIRQPMANTETTISAEEATPTIITNSQIITFPLASVDWLAGANITYYGLWTAQAGSSGILLAAGPLDTPMAVLSGQQLRFAVGDLKITAQ